jgi:hypothetical protein
MLRPTRERVLYIEKKIQIALMLSELGSILRRWT